MTKDFDREWTQDELRAHLIGMGFQDSDFEEDEILKQGFKYISNAPLTPQEIARVKQLIAEHPELTTVTRPPDWPNGLTATLCKRQDEFFVSFDVSDGSTLRIPKANVFRMYCLATRMRAEKA